MNLKKILVILINCLCLWFTFKIFFDYYTECNLVKTERPIHCVITEKDCKYSRATSHCNLLYKAKEYRVSINKCDSLKIGDNDTDFYHDKKFDTILQKGYIEKKFLVAMPIMLILVLFFTAKNWKKISE